VVTVGKKRRVLAFELVAVLGLATALAYGMPGAHARHTRDVTDEPVLLLLSGNMLLAIAGALRRLSF
jgi:hypothetical protein